MTKPDESEIQAEMQDARDALFDAELLLNKDRLKSAVSRAYYAAFHAARALLSAQAINAKSHKGTIRLFHLHCIKNQTIPNELGKILSDLHDERELADYHATTGSLNEDDVARLVADARTFVETIDQTIQSQ